MLTWLVASALLHLVYVFTPTTLYLPTEGVMAHLGGRDTLPDASALVGRARRAQANWQESYPVFLAFAVASLAVDAPEAAGGAMLFLAARTAYLPLYLSGIPGLRSASWGVAVAGLAWMAVSLF